MRITSTAFDDGGNIPQRYTCDGDGGPPPLTVADIPAGTSSLTLEVTDPDAPGGTFVHWIKRGIEPSATDLSGGTEEANSGGGPGWYPPCPPSGTHRYVFTVTAMDAEGVALETATLVGRYARP